MASITDSLVAFEKFPSKTALYIASEIVSVFPIIFPPRISVIPTSPKDLAIDRVKPQIMPCEMFGRITYWISCLFEVPSNLETSKIDLFRTDAEDITDFTINGNPEIKAANKTPTGLKIILISKTLCNPFPIKPSLPNIMRKKNPRDIGGKTSGREIKDSIN